MNGESTVCAPLDKAQVVVVVAAAAARRLGVDEIEAAASTSRLPTQ